MRSISALILLLSIACASHSQVLNKLKNKITGKAKTEAEEVKYDARQKAREKVYGQLNEITAEYDSSEVDYAILLSDNAGLLGGRPQNEFSAKFIRMARTVRSLYNDRDLTDEENARLNLQFGQSAYAAGKYVYASRRLDNAAEYFRRAGLTSDMGYLKTLATQGLLYTSMGRFRLAEKYTLEALELRKERLGEQNAAVAASLNNLAVLHYNLGQYNEAEKEVADCILLLEKNRDGAAVSYATVLNNRAIIYQSMGRYEQAVTSLKSALGILDQLNKPAPRLHQRFYSNLALLHQLMGKYTEAELIYTALERRIPKGTAEEANLLNNKAILYLLMNKEADVESLLKNSAEIYRSSLGGNSPAYAKVISDLGNYFRYKGRYADAKPLLEQALNIRKEALGEMHPLFAQSQEDLAILYWKENDLASARPLYKEVMDHSLDFINRYFPPMSESEKTRYWDLLSPRFERFYNFAIELSKTNPAISIDMLEYRMATKGLLLNSSRKVSRAILSSGNDNLIRDYADWVDSKEQLMVLYAYSKQELQEQGINIDSIQQVSNEMEKRLSESSSAFSAFYFASKTSYDDLRHQLKNGEAVVEMIKLRNFDQVLTDKCRYIALITDKDRSHPAIVILNEGNDLEGKFAKNYRLSMKNKVNDEQSYIHYWQPLLGELQNKNVVYFSSDGVYTQINPYTLKKPGGSYVLDQMDIVLLGNLRDLVPGNNSNVTLNKNATLLGYPDYGKGMIVQLPGTKVEVEAINRLLVGSGYKVAELLQRDATEANLKAAHRVAILHIATHGYFLKDVERTSWPVGVMADHARDNVLLRSGLMLTGASESDRLAPGLDSSNNGIMTSYEAMNLDLQGTDLVVLSACETGLGEIKAGEGVYGLQRAFLAAGAEAIIMSLWKVDDAATQALMNNFYSNWISTNDRHKAFRMAQQQLMAKYKEPLYWGAFIMME